MYILEPTRFFPKLFCHFIHTFRGMYCGMYSVFVMPSSPVWCCSLIEYLGSKSSFKIFFCHQFFFECAIECTVFFRSPGTHLQLVVAEVMVKLQVERGRSRRHLSQSVSSAPVNSNREQVFVRPSVHTSYFYVTVCLAKTEMNCPLPGNLTQGQGKKNPSSSHVNSKDTQREQNDLLWPSVRKLGSNTETHVVGPELGITYTCQYK